ncbi:MAG: hypothetical protein HY343_00400 [Lentisphaerae bacterium]|nr:hypothetical protein [Lentisphaerota bacterium]
MLNQDWDIKAIGKACAQCQTLFADHQATMSRLVFGKDGYERSDFCEPCWAGQNAAVEAVSSWKGVFRLPPPPPPEPLKKETAESLLRGLMEKGDAVKKNSMFILAVMLERRRILVERAVQVREDGVRVRVYEHRKTGESFIIVDPALSLDQLEPVQKEVMAMLSGGTEGAAGSPAVTEVPPPPVEPPPSTS